MFNEAKEPKEINYVVIVVFSVSLREIVFAATLGAHEDLAVIMRLALKLAHIRNTTISPFLRGLSVNLTKEDIYESKEFIYGPR